MRSFRLCLLGCLAAVLVILFQSGFLFSETQMAPQKALFSEEKGVKSFDYGDANGDGIIDVGDVVHLINYLFKGGPDPNPLEAGDANCDQAVDVGDVVWLINYLFKSGDPPPCFPPSDPFDPDSMEYQSELFKHSICDTGVTNIIWLTPVNPTYDDYTEMQGDTMVLSSLCFFGTADGSYMWMPPPPKSTTKQGGEFNGSEETGQWAAGANYLPNSAFFHNAQYRPHPFEPWEIRGIQIIGNMVMVGNSYFTFDDPSPVTPSLAQQVLDSKDTPPPALTAEDIAYACSEGAMGIANSCIISVRHLRKRTWITNEGTTCTEETYHYFLFEHCWEYICPDGPQKRRQFVRFDGYKSLVCDGTVISYDSFCALYNLVLQTR